MTDTLTIGIQGGKGSFNEEAVRRYCDENDITDFELEYLYTTERVLRRLNEGEIDRGFFALQNAVGGVVRETIDALSAYNCDIIAEYEIIVNHCLLAKSGKTIGDIDTIISHPQAIRQCQKTLREKYPDKKVKEGEGDLIDQATAAKALAEGKLDESIGILASKVCAELYENLDVLEVGLQDRKKNLTTFLFVKERV